MSRVIIAVGRSKEGAAMDVGLYTGEDADAAISAVDKAAQSGRIVYAEIYRDPIYWKREDFSHLPAEKERAVARAAALKELEAEKAAAEKAAAEKAAAEKAAGPPEKEAQKTTSKK